MAAASALDSGPQRVTDRDEEFLITALAQRRSGNEMRTGSGYVHCEEFRTRFAQSSSQGRGRGEIGESSESHRRGLAIRWGVG